MPHHCARCEAVLPVMDGETAAFCAQCGLPQLRVSEALLDAAAAGPTTAAADEREEGAAVAPAAGPPWTAGLDWPLLLRVLLVATVLGLLPAVLLPQLLFGGTLGMACLLLMPLLGLASGVAYLRWRPASRMTAGEGARMGLALGTMLAVAECALTAVASFVLRYGRHSRGLQQTFDLVMQQMEVQVRAAQPQTPERLLQAMRSPEWHAGWFLVMQGVMMLMLIVAGAVSGLVAGALLGARQQQAARGGQ